jgi:DNA (cytosine-5)-methyltransferase 1
MPVMPPVGTRKRRRTTEARIWEQRTATAIDLFSGAGGTSYGLLAAGFEVRAAVDNDEAASVSYERNIGLKPIVDDIRNVSGRRLLRRAGLRRGECLLLVACAPCQGFSPQGRAAGGTDPTADKRNLLIFDVVRLVGEIWPAYLLLENVPGLARGVGRPIFDQIKEQLRALTYEVSDEGILEAADYGVPQRRERLIALVRRSDMPEVKLPQPSHCDATKKERIRKNGHLVSWRTVREAIGNLQRLEAGEQDPNDPLHSASRHTDEVQRRIAAIRKDGGSRTDLPQELVLSCHHEHTGHRDVYGRMWWRRPAPTLTGGCIKPSKGRFIHPYRDRGITPREAALLQDFPPRATFYGTRDEIAAQIGNAVPPALGRAVSLPVREAFEREFAQRERREGHNL